MSARTRPMTTMQGHALSVLVDVGLADSGEVARHLLIDASRARSALSGLELRGYVERQYTGHRFRGCAYYATVEGMAAYDAEYGDTDA